MHLHKVGFYYPTSIKDRTIAWQSRSTMFHIAVSRWACCPQAAHNTYLKSNSATVTNFSIAEGAIKSSAQSKRK